MHIDVVDTEEGFDALRDNWDAIYRADPEANIFLSWQWLDAWLDTYISPWFVLAAKRSETDPDYVGLLPLRMQTHFDADHGFSNEIVVAGANFSDYTGILARPECEAEAIPALADYAMRKFNWARFSMENLLMSQQRRRLLLGGFGKARFTHAPIGYKYADDPVDHAICPMVNLPENWDDYLGTLSANNRQKIRRLLKKVDAAEGYRIAFSKPEDIEQNLTILLDFWTTKWGPKKGEDKAKEIARTNRLMLMRCAEDGMLLLPIFYHGDRAVALLAILVDDCKKSLSFLITGRDETYDEMPAGYLLHAHCIRHAIEHGYATYDFLRGNEPYKYLFAPQVRHLSAVALTTKSNRNLGGKPDPRGFFTMLDMTIKFEDEDKLASAELGYSQILKMEPRNALALYRYGRLLARKGAHADAKELLSRSVEVEADGDNAWFWLARSLYSLGEDAAALDAFHKVVALQPDNEEARQRVVELTLKPRLPSRPATAGRTEAAKPVPASRQSSEAVRKPDTAVRDLIDASVDPNWILKKLAPQPATQLANRKREA